MKEDLTYEDLDLTFSGLSSDEKVLELFYEEALITDVLYKVKSGKEATVYCCRAHPQTGESLLAAKIYRSRQNRTFKNDAVYQQGRRILDSRAKRAFENKSKKGQTVQFNQWIGHEYRTLQLLHRAGAAVPAPLQQFENAILMAYCGDEEGAATPLQQVTLTQGEARPLFEAMLDNVRLWLTCNIVHADLSPYNILYWQGKLTVIDFPQAVDPRFNAQAFDLLCRDLGNLCRYWAKFDVQGDPVRLAGEMWSRFSRAEL